MLARLPSSASAAAAAPLLLLLLSLLLSPLVLAAGAATTLDQWLAQSGAGEYLPQFQDGGFEELADLEFLDPDDLASGSFESLPAEVRTRVAKALQELKEQGIPDPPPPPPPPPPRRGGSMKDNLAPSREVDVVALDATLKEAAEIHTEGDLRKASAKMLHVIYHDPSNPRWRINLGVLYEAQWKVTGEDRLVASAVVMYQEGLDRGAGEDDEAECVRHLTPRTALNCLPVLRCCTLFSCVLSVRRLGAILVQMSHLMCHRGKGADAVALFDQYFAQHEGMMDRILAVAEEYANAMKASMPDATPPAAVREPLPIHWQRPKDEL
jgi:hypothetical protein